MIKPTDMHVGRAMLEDKAKIGLVVILPETPLVWEYDPERGGQAGGLLQMGIVAAVTSSLNSHAKQLPLDDLRVIEDLVAKALAKKGLEVKVIKVKADDKAFTAQRFEQKNATHHAWDLRHLRSQFGVDRILSVSVPMAGFNYPFSGVIPFSGGEPMAFVQGEAFMVDLTTNTYQWYRKVRVLRGVGKAWDEPKYPGLTAKYYEVLEIAKDEILDDLLK